MEQVSPSKGRLWAGWREAVGARFFSHCVGSDGLVSLVADLLNCAHGVMLDCYLGGGYTEHGHHSKQSACAHTSIFSLLSSSLEASRAALACHGQQLSA